MSWLFWLPLVVGAAAIFLWLPRPRAFPVYLGALAGLVVLGVTAWLFFSAIGVTVESCLFLIFSALSVLSGSLLVTQRNPARAALSFALVVLSTCGLFMLLAAPFLMAATIVIYAGAIVVTFLFVLMLAQQAGLSDADARSREPLLATVTGFALLGALLYVLHLTYTSAANMQLVNELLADVQTAQAQVAAGQAVKLAPVANKLLRRLYSITQNAENREPELEDDEQFRELRGVRERASFAREVRGRIEPILIELLHEPTDNAAKVDTAAELNKVAVPLGELRLLALRREQGLLRPAGGVSLSPLSGPPASTPFEDLRVDADGRPQLPAENSQYLGRSLFTDFLLPVELAGTLLLVATVGAIAIAQRRVHSEKVL